MKPLLFPRDLLRFLYWLFFKPITLERYMQQIDPTLSSDASIIVLWRRSKQYPKLRTILPITFFHILMTSSLFILLIIGGSALVGWDVNWFGGVAGVAFGMIFGMLAGVAFGVAPSVIVGVAVGVAFGVVFGVIIGGVPSVASDVVFGMTRSVAADVVFGAVLAMSIGAAFGVVAPLRMKDSVGTGVLLSAIVSVMLGVLFGMTDGAIVGVMLGALSCIGSLIFYFRLINYSIEVIYSFILSRTSRSLDLRLSPVMWDELIWLPLPALDRQLVSIGKENREAGMKAIAHVASSFGQGWAARRALIELTAYDVQNAKSLESIAGISETLSWLPPDARATYKSLLLGLDTVSRHVKASMESDTIYNRQEQLRLALETTESMRRGFAYDPNWRISHLMSPALAVWERILANELAIAQKQEAIPNVYVAGRPLDTKSKVFRGRRDVFKALEQELISPAEQRPAVLLFGARRTGKTSVLRQIPETLGPQVVSVAVDLQDAALEKDAVGLLSRISDKIRNDALQFRHLEFNELSRTALEANPYSAFAEWLRKLQETIGERWILLNLDEYEYLEKMMNDGRLDDRVFQLLRTLLQNHPRLTLLFSGAHTLEDLSPIWSHHLINARVIKVNPLSHDEARELITRPIPNYPLVYTENAVQDIISVTACQPYLIQAICRDLVNTMNERRQFHADQKDVEEAIESVLMSATAYFQDLWSGPDTNEVQRTIMLAIAHSQDGWLQVTEIDKALVIAGYNEQTARTRQAVLRALEHRDVLKPDENGWRFEIELVRRWIRRTQLGLKG